MQRTNEQLIEYAKEHYGVTKGCYVSWQPSVRRLNRRFGCVMGFADISRDGCVEVQASNARLRVPLVVLRNEPECDDAIAADQRGIYGAQP